MKTPVVSSYLKAKTLVELSKIVRIARKYDIAIALIQHERDTGKISADYADSVIEELRRNARLEMEKGSLE